MAFKNALCQDPIAGGVPGYSYPPYAFCCKRRSGHEGRYRVVFSDGGVKEWDEGDLEAELTKVAPAP